MKKLLFFAIFGVILLPVLVSAQGMMNFSDVQGNPLGMMQYVENKALGSESYTEATNLMTKMMTGKLTEAEANKLADFMNQYPGPMGVMMNQYRYIDGYGMMSSGQNYSN